MEGTGYFRDAIAQIVEIPDATWISPDDFTVAYTSARTITLGGGPPPITDDSQLIYVIVIPLVGPARPYVQGVAGVKLTHAANVITIHNVVDPFTAGDSYRVGIGAKSSVVFHGDVNVDNVSVNTSGLIGKPAGSDGDFDTVYTSATKITCSNLPSWYLGLTAEDIETIRQLDGTTGTVINTYSRDDMPMLVAANVITVTGAAFGATDKFVVFTNVDETNYRLKLLDKWETIQACNDSTDFVAYGDSANIANDANHITGAVGVLWDKTGGTNADSGVEDTIVSKNLSAFSPNDYVMVTVYIPDLVDIAKVSLLLGTDSGNHNYWEWSDTALNVGEWNVLIAPISEGTILGLGWDQENITWLAIVVTFDNAADTLNGMLVDQISVISSESVGENIQTGKYVELTIANGANVSDVLDLRGYKHFVIFMSAAWTVANLAFLTCYTAGGTYVDVQDSFDNRYTTAVTQGKAYASGTSIAVALKGVPFLKLQSVSQADPDVDVNQGAERIIGIWLEK